MPLTEGEKIGLIAGSGEFPITFADAARASGYKVMAIAIQGFASPELANHVDEIHWLGVGQLDTLIALCHKNNVSNLALAGKIEHVTLFNLGIPETRVIRLLMRLSDRRAQSLARALIEELESENIHVLDSSLFLKPLMPPEGLLTPRRPLQKREKRAIEFGWPLARKVAELDIGQSLIVKDGMVVAVEGAEGTDKAILRAGELAGPGTVVIKVSRPRQDFRFDLPVVGIQTIRTMSEAKASALAISAGETILLNREAVTALAEESNIAIIAQTDSPANGGKMPC
ncbi:MAG: UDP-2,3-diacylglucosamine diphosphatase LpxI [Candidatus Sumerlaeia bacterium]|nr:UDP-2,3-diacylglucosamine diphosphatase LpxI [Candidatus Sumerlaeia bacterium]